MMVHINVVELNELTKLAVLLGVYLGKENSPNTFSQFILHLSRVVFGFDNSDDLDLNLRRREIQTSHYVHVLGGWLGV
jgi:hypothetical protein